MSYADLTVADRNRIKRWLQRRRLQSAVTLAPDLRETPRVVCDFGAGNGEFCKLLIGRYPQARVICYEPSSDLFGEARDNLKGLPMIEVTQALATIPAGTVDLLFCLEVFEHLPERETLDVFRTAETLLASGGAMIIGVPVEIGIPAIYKGLFRMTRRYGDFDANVRNVVMAAVGRPPTERPLDEVEPGLRFHPYHIGFDVRAFRKTLADFFVIERVSASPFPPFGAWLNPEAYFVVRKRDR